jgi:preprotein translocase subunit SecG
MSIVLGVLTFILVLVALFLILVILMQKDKSGGGMGTALGGGMAESTFGADTTNVLSKATINSSIIFFILGTLLFLGRIYERNHRVATGALPTIAAPATSNPMPLPAAPTAAPLAPSKAPSAAPTAVPAKKP